MGCSNSKNNIHENSKNIPGDISSENSKISSVTSSNDRNSSNSLKYQLNTPAPSPSTIDYHNSNNNSHNNNYNNYNNNKNEGIQTIKKQFHIDTSPDSTNNHNNNSNNNNSSNNNNNNNSNLNQINLQNQPSNSIGNLNNAKRPSLLSLSNDSSLNDITVNIPDPFRSNYKVTDSLYHKNFRKLYRGIDKNRREVLVEFTEIRPYESAGHTQVDFFNRIDILRQLDHISIPKVLDVFDGSEVNRVVFDYFPGKDLDCLLKMKGSLPPHAIKPFMLALVSVAQYLHNLNILHRNLSPSSIILAAFSSFVSIQQMRVTGFTRPARMLDNFHYDISTEDQHEKEEKDILGGISIVKEYDMDVFSAPELATSHQGPAVDLYSIGGILYNITTGSAPPPLGKLDQSLSFSGDVWKREEIVNWKIQDLVTRLLLPNPQERPSLDDIIRSFN